jgi:hypothetical protein
LTHPTLQYALNEVSSCEGFWDVGRFTFCRPAVQSDEFLYRSPHCWVQVRAAFPDGRLWSLEGMSARKLRKLEITANPLQAGDDLIVTGNPARYPNERRMLLQIINRQSDGSTWSTNNQRVHSFRPG